MAFETERRTFDSGYAGTQVRTEAGEIDLGLRKYLLGVYNYMASGLLLSGIVALLVANTSLINAFFVTRMDSMGAPHIVGYAPLGWVAILAPIGMIFFMNANRQL